jgi:hypothetical protein
MPIPDLAAIHAAKAQQDEQQKVAELAAPFIPDADLNGLPITVAYDGRIVTGELAGMNVKGSSADGLQFLVYVVAVPELVPDDCIDDAPVDLDEWLRPYGTGPETA